MVGGTIGAAVGAATGMGVAAYEYYQETQPKGTVTAVRFLLLLWTNQETATLTAQITTDILIVQTISRGRLKLS